MPRSPPRVPDRVGQHRVRFALVDDGNDDRLFQFQMAILEEDLVDQG
jgi:hypothetical protein